MQRVLYLQKQISLPNTTNVTSCDKFSILPVKCHFVYGTVHDNIDVPIYYNIGIYMYVSVQNLCHRPTNIINRYKTCHEQAVRSGISAIVLTVRQEFDEYDEYRYECPEHKIGCNVIGMYRICRQLETTPETSKLEAVNSESL